MSDKVEKVTRFFWKSYELTPAQYRNAKMLGADDVFVETSDHRRDDEFIRSAWR